MALVLTDLVFISVVVASVVPPPPKTLVYGIIPNAMNTFQELFTSLFLRL